MTKNEIAVSDRLAGLPVKHLAYGAHDSSDAGMCAMEAVAFLAGEPHSDAPQCTCPVIAAFVRFWNDGLPSDEDRVRLLGPLLTEILDTRGSEALAERRSLMAFDWLVRVQTPAWMHLTPALVPHTESLAALPELNGAGAIQSARTTIVAAGAAARAAAKAAARVAARAAAWDAAGAAAGVALAPVVASLQSSAANLVRRMCALRDLPGGLVGVPVETSVAHAAVRKGVAA